jgi:hypothetical protein
MYKDMVHNFQIAVVLKEGLLAIKRISMFIEEVCDGYQSPDRKYNNRLSPDESKICKLNMHETLS